VSTIFSYESDWGTVKVQKDYAKQIKIISGVANGNNVTVSIRTEGARYVGKNIILSLHKYNYNTSQYEYLGDFPSIAINELWNNLQSINYNSNQSGVFKILGRIQTEIGIWHPQQWEDRVGVTFAIE
jgi:hypothetical protein